MLKRCSSCLTGSIQTVTAVNDLFLEYYKKRVKRILFIVSILNHTPCSFSAEYMVSMLVRITGHADVCGIIWSGEVG